MCPNSAVHVVANFSVWLVLRRHTTELEEVISLFYLNVCKKICNPPLIPENYYFVLHINCIAIRYQAEFSLPYLAA